MWVTSLNAKLVNTDSLSSSLLRKWKAVLWRTAGRPAPVCALLVVATLGAFWPAIHAGFVNYDDPVYVTANRHVQSGLSLESIRWAFANLDAGFWHPLTWLSLLLDCQLFGQHPEGYHLTSLLLHAANTVLLFRVFQLITRATWRSAFVAALFALHPLHVETVAWVAERKGVLSTFFWMVSLLMYVRYVQQSQVQNPRAKVSYGLALLFFACGLMSKTVVVTLPFILLLLDWWPLGRLQLRTMPRLIREKVPFLAVGFVAGLLTIHAERGMGALKTESQFPVWYSLANAIVSYVHYVGQTAWPSGLAVHYPYPGSFSFWPLAGAVLLGLIVSVHSFWSSAQRPYVAFGWIWYGLTLLPVIGLIQIGDHTRADRYTYLPLIGIFTLLTWGAHDLTKRWRYQGITLAACALVVTSACVVLTRQQIAYWKDSETLLRHAIAVTEGDYATENNLGIALADKGQWDEAMAHYQRALQIAPEYAEGQNNLGRALLQKGQIDEAIPHLESALRSNPSHAGAQNNLGVALAQKGRVDEAITHFQEALRLKPGFADAEYDLGTALLQRGQVDGSILHFQEALKYQPGYTDAHHNLGNALIQKGRVDDAIAQFQRALEIRPNSPETHNSLGRVLLRSGQVDGSILHFEKALEGRPDYAEAHSSLGLALLQKGRVEEAVTHLQKALEVRPRDAEAQGNLGAALLRKGQVDEAIIHFQMALEIRPGYAEAQHNLGTALLRKGEVEQSVAHFQKALELRPNFGEAAYSLSNALLQRGQVREAVAGFQRALEIRPDFAEAQNNLAWVLATCPDASIRNGARAVELAEQADRLSGGSNAMFVGTLAAAYAEAGRFPEAVAASQRALQVAEAQTNAAQVNELRPLLSRCQAGSPFRDAGLTNSAAPARSH